MSLDRVAEGIEQLLTQQRIVWIAYRGEIDGERRASILVPEHFQYSFPPQPPEQDPFERPLENALETVVEFLSSHYWYRAIISIPRALPQGESTVEMIRLRGWPELSLAEGMVIRGLMALPLGEWADPDRSALLWAPRQSEAET